MTAPEKAYIRMLSGYTLFIKGEQAKRLYDMFVVQRKVPTDKAEFMYVTDHDEQEYVIPFDKIEFIHFERDEEDEEID